MESSVLGLRSHSRSSKEEDRVSGREAADNVKTYPLFFKHHETVSGHDFLAWVSIFGRALMVEEPDCVWAMYGVQPGCITEVGQSVDEARLQFRAAFRELLFEIATDAPDFTEFEKQAREILQQVNEPLEAEWKRAVEAVRVNQILPDPVIDTLPRESAENDSHVLVQKINETETKYTPSHNQPDQYSLSDARRVA